MPFLDGSEGKSPDENVTVPLYISMLTHDSEGKGIVEYGLRFSVISFVAWRCDGCILLFACEYFQTISDER